jgi:ABC-type dipeptide/oligopeptide/nickel transport system permease subunit
VATTARPLSATEAIDLNKAKSRSLWADAMRRLLRNKAAVISLVIVTLFALVAIFAGPIAPRNPVEQTSGNSMRPPIWETSNPGRQPNPANIRVSLIVGIVPQFLLVTIGVTIGLVAGFAGGWLDNLLMRITEIIASFPDLLFIITLTVALRDTWFGKTFNGLLLIFAAVAVIGWTGMARLVRGQVLSLKEKEFVEAARALGVPTPQILFRHVLPNTLATIIVSVSFSIPALISTEAVLTVLGVGMRPSVQPNNPFPTSLGVMLDDGFNNLSSGPWMLLFPVALIATLVLCFTFIGDGLRDALDPRDSGA